MKKKFLGMLLSLCLIVSLVPAAVFADGTDPIGTGDVNMDGKVDFLDVILLQKYLEGECTLDENQHLHADMDGDGSVDIADFNALQEDIGLPMFDVNVTYGYASVAGTEVSQARQITKVTITAIPPSPDMKFVKWIVEYGNIHLEDEGSETTSFEMSDHDVSVKAEFEASPDAEVITLTIPYTTTVKKGGNGNPGKTTFDLELIDSHGDSLGVGKEGSYEDVTVKASVTTNGAGTYKGEMTITGSVKQLKNLLEEGGVYVRQIDAGEDGWTYDDAVWAVFMKRNTGNEDGEIAEMAVSDDPNDYVTSEYSAVTYPTTYTDKAYDVVWKPTAMSFTNTYDVSSDEEYVGADSGDSDKDSGNDTDKNAKTGDDTNLALLFALLGLSAAGLAGTGIYGRRKADSHIK